MNPERTPPTMTHDEMIAKMLSDPEVRAEYERLEREEFFWLDIVLNARRAAGLTQAQVAERMGTQAPAVARLERALATGKPSPSLATLRKYVNACGKELVVTCR
ncbi:helix-turn-helix transcriptional regulator [Allochromatium humboldtianum]